MSFFEEPLVRAIKGVWNLAHPITRERILQDLLDTREIKDSELLIETVDEILHPEDADRSDYDEGYEEGRDSGHTEGFEEGHAKGLIDGKIEGYQEGYDKARAEFERGFPHDN